MLYHCSSSGSVHSKLIWFFLPRFFPVLVFKQEADLLFYNGLAVFYQGVPYVGIITSIVLVLSHSPRLTLFLAIVTGWNTCPPPPSPPMLWWFIKKKSNHFLINFQHNKAEAFEIITAIKHQCVAQSQSHPQSLLTENVYFVHIIHTLLTPSSSILESHSLHVSLSLV